MKGRMLNLFLILTSLIGYMEWGKDSSVFLFTAEWEVITKLFTNTKSAVHPFTVIPMLGQLLLLFTLFQKQPGKVLTYIGLGCIGLLLLFIFLIGLMSLNVRVLLSTIPFVALGIYTIVYYRRRRAGRSV
ncbi:MAG: hypothetical protein KDC07_08705 [Chitinophagaceae bacterium]|nr:hypothetical protein [Chitinophagaceae bacterium]